MGNCCAAPNSRIDYSDNSDAETSKYPDRVVPGLLYGRAALVIQQMLRELGPAAEEIVEVLADDDHLLAGIWALYRECLIMPSDNFSYDAKDVIGAIAATSSGRIPLWSPSQTTKGLPTAFSPAIATFLNKIVLLQHQQEQQKESSDNNNSNKHDIGGGDGSGRLLKELWARWSEDGPRAIALAAKAFKARERKMKRMMKLSSPSSPSTVQGGGGGGGGGVAAADDGAEALTSYGQEDPSTRGLTPDNLARCTVKRILELAPSYSSSSCPDDDGTTNGTCASASASAVRSEAAGILMTWILVSRLRTCAGHSRANKFKPIFYGTLPFARVVKDGNNKRRVVVISGAGDDVTGNNSDAAAAEEVREIRSAAQKKIVESLTDKTQHVCKGQSLLYTFSAKEALGEAKEPVYDSDASTDEDLDDDDDDDVFDANGNPIVPAPRTGTAPRRAAAAKPTSATTTATTATTTTTATTHNDNGSGNNEPTADSVSSTTTNNNNNNHAAAADDHQSDDDDDDDDNDSNQSDAEADDDEEMARALKEDLKVHWTTKLPEASAPSSTSGGGGNSAAAAPPSSSSSSRRDGGGGNDVGDGGRDPALRADPDHLQASLSKMVKEFTTKRENGTDYDDVTQEVRFLLRDSPTVCAAFTAFCAAAREGAQSAVPAVVRTIVEEIVDKQVDDVDDEDDEEPEPQWNGLLEDPNFGIKWAQEAIDKELAAIAAYNEERRQQRAKHEMDRQRRKQKQEEGEKVNSHAPDTGADDKEKDDTAAASPSAAPTDAAASSPSANDDDDDNNNTQSGDDENEKSDAEPSSDLEGNDDDDDDDDEIQNSGGDLSASGMRNKENGAECDYEHDDDDDDDEVGGGDDDSEEEAVWETDDDEDEAELELMDEEENFLALYALLCIFSPSSIDSKMKKRLRHTLNNGDRIRLVSWASALAMSVAVDLFQETH